MLLTILSIVGVLAVAAAQARLPTLSWLGNVRLDLLPAVVAYGALTARRPLVAVAWAGLAGLAQDSLSAGPFGTMTAAYAVAALVLWWLRESLEPGLPWVQVVAGAAVSVGAALAAALVVGWSWVLLGKLIWLAVWAAVVTPVVFLAVDLVRLNWGTDE